MFPKDKDKPGNDFIIEMHSSSLSRIRKQLTKIADSRFRPAELFLSLGTAFFGGIVGAFMGGITLSSPSWWIYYVLLPILTTIGIVSYGFLDFGLASNPAVTATNILEELPDPETTTAASSELENLGGVWNFESVTRPSNKDSSGQLRMTVRQSRITVAGLIIGESKTKIGEITSLLCGVYNDRNQFIMIYRLTAFNDDNTQDISENVFSGIMFTEDDTQTEIRGNWYRLYGPPISGIATLTKKIVK